MPPKKKNVEADPQEDNKNKNLITLALGEGSKKITVSAWKGNIYIHVNDFNKGKSITFNVAELTAFHKHYDEIMRCVSNVLHDTALSQQEEEWSTSTPSQWGLVQDAQANTLTQAQASSYREPYYLKNMHQNQRTAQAKSTGCHPSALAQAPPLPPPQAHSGIPNMYTPNTNPPNGTSNMYGVPNTGAMYGVCTDGSTYWTQPSYYQQ
jgi:hypothetical protein